MTEIQQRYKRLLKELRKCEKLNNSKSYFLAQAVHDLRQPIQALILFAEVLKDTPLNEEQKNLAEKIHNSTIEIKELLTNYLDLSKLNEGGVIYEPRHFKLKPLTDKLADNYTIICKDKNKHFNYQTCNADIFSDPILVERILQNLLSNAVKYGKDNISLRCENHNGKISFEIKDDGKGIDAKDLPHIFDEYYQSRKDEHNRKHGAGLGLFITQKIADKLGTKINVTTKKNKGTTFSFNLG